MKKSTKILVPALAVLALGMAASVTGTVAWYTASSATIIKETADTGTISTSASVLEENTFYFVPTVSVTPASSKSNLALTDTEGETFAAISNGDNPETWTLAPAVAGSSSALYGTVGVSVKVYKTRSGSEGNYSYTDEFASGSASLIAAQGTYAFTLTASGRARITQTEGSKFSCGYSQTVSGSFVIASDGTYSVSLTTTYCSVGGEATDRDATAGDVVNSVDTTVSASIALSWNA